MKHTFQAIFETDGLRIGVVFPDLEGCRTFGEDYEDAVLMGVDLLEATLGAYYDLGKPIPSANLNHEVPNDGRTAFFTVNAPEPPVETMTVADAAILLGVSDRRVRALIKAGRLTAIKAGRDNMVTVESVDKRLTSEVKSGRPAA